MNVVTKFFLQDWILHHYNAYTIVLIPKINETDNLNQFRPIALANFKNKIITRILDDRLATLLPFFISLE